MSLIISCPALTIQSGITFKLDKSVYLKKSVNFNESDFLLPVSAITLTLNTYSVLDPVVDLL